MRIKLIVNPSAGKGNFEQRIPELVRLFAKAGYNFILDVTKSPGHATELAKEAAKSFDTVVAVGGDGTVNEVITGIIGTDATLGIIPTGYSNDIARTLNIPLDINKAVTTIKTGRAVPFDVGKDVDGYFGTSIGIGFPCEVDQQIKSVTFFRGSAAAAVSIIQAAKNLQPFAVQIETDNHQFSAAVMGIFIQNTCYTGGGVKMAPEAKFDDGLLDVVIMHEVSKLELLTNLPKAYSGKHVNHPSIQILQTTAIRISTSMPMRKSFDATLLGTTPVDAKVIPAAINVWAPGR